jgi:LPS-assembly lipoprotein
MKKIIILIVASLLLSACGFHVPSQNSEINVVIAVSENNIFTPTIKKCLTPEITPRLVLQIGKPIQRKQNTTYYTNHQVRSYTLNFSVPVKIFNKNKKMLLLQNFSASSHLNKITDTQADTLQTQEAYQQLQDIVAKKLLRRL